MNASGTHPGIVKSLLEPVRPREVGRTFRAAGCRTSWWDTLGEYRMGRRPGKRARSHEGRVHEVRIHEELAVGRYEVMRRKPSLR